MELGARLKAARIEAGLSQRQLCGEKITRNMLSQIENGSARPSMDTLRYLAGRLGKPVSYFLEEEALILPNQRAMEQAREAWASGDAAGVLRALESCHAPDPVFDGEKQLLERLAVLALAEGAFDEGKAIYAGELLDKLGAMETGYCARELERKRLLLLARARPQRRQELCRALPPLDEELLIRARDALDRGEPQRSGALLDAAEDKACPDWNFLRGEVHLARQAYREAAECYHRAEQAYPEKTAPRLERCYRELEDYKKAYFYACKQKK